MKQGAKGQGSAPKRMARTARVQARRFAALDSPITLLIIALNVVVFALQLLSYHFASNGVTAALWYIPAYSLSGGVHEIAGGVLGGYPDGVLLSTSFEPWRMLTVMFTHSVTFLPHILFNMLALFIFGRHLESILGRVRYLVLYLLAGIGGSLGVMLWGYAQPSDIFTPTVGASGAIFGVLAATVVAFRAMNTNVTSLVVLLAINFGIGFMPGANVSWQAHLGGMIVGALATWLIVRTRGPRLKRRQIIGLVSLGVVLVLLCCAYLVVSPF
ncbi:MAG: rhomboid family intramembrane serine protease [Leucobacter sp.]